MAYILQFKSFLCFHNYMSFLYSTVYCQKYPAHRGRHFP